MRAKTSTVAVIMGNREDTIHPCHAALYDGVKEWTEQFAATAPEQEELYRGLELLMFAAEQYKNSAAYWNLISIQGHAKILLPLLDDTHRTLLLERFEAAYPREKLLPIQEELVVMLGGKKKRRLFGFLR